MHQDDALWEGLLPLLGAMKTGTAVCGAGLGGATGKAIW
jgi:hypothetical protein